MLISISGLNFYNVTRIYYVSRAIIKSDIHRTIIDCCCANETETNISRHRLFLVSIFCTSFVTLVTLHLCESFLVRDIAQIYPEQSHYTVSPCRPPLPKKKNLMGYLFNSFYMFFPVRLV